MKLTKAEQEGRVTRVQLADDNWWDILTKPKWKHMRDFRAALRKDDTDTDILADIALANFTVGWSYAESVTVDAIGEREIEDLMKVLPVVVEKLLPLLSPEGTAS